MSEQYYTLKPNIIVEPLINNWYAWIYLVSPLTYSHYLQHHIKLLKSYLQAPHIHQQANTEVRLRGGTFLDLGEQSQIEAIKLLLEYTLEECDDLNTLKNSVSKLNEAMKPYIKDPKSFQDLYLEIPDSLAGLIEFVYDLNNIPSLRFIEPLIYSTSYYKPYLQSVLFYEQDPDKRAFALSTPRLEQQSMLQIRLPFNSMFYDAVFSTREKSITTKQMQTIYDTYLKNENIEFKKFKDLFDNLKNPKLSKHDRLDKVHVKYFGHACVLMQNSTYSILVDPLISYENKFSDITRLTFQDLPEKIDYVLITHTHQDHTVLETLLQIRYKIQNIIVPRCNQGSLQDPSIKIALEHCGFKNIYELDELESIKLQSGEIKAIPFYGEHGDLDIRSKTAYYVELENQTALFLADSKNLSPILYHRLRKFVIPVNIIFIGLESEGAPINWLYGPLLLNQLNRSQCQNRRLNGSNAKESFDIIKTLGCYKVYIYAMAYEPWLTFISNLDYETGTEQISEAKKLMSLCKENKIKAELLYGTRDINF